MTLQSVRFVFCQSPLPYLVDDSKGWKFTLGLANLKPDLACTLYIARSLSFTTSVHFDLSYQ